MHAVKRSQAMKPNQQHGRWAVIKCTVATVSGCVIAIAGTCLLLYVYAFAFMVPDGAGGWELQFRILKKMLLTPAVLPTVLGILFVGAGIVLVAVSCISLWDGKDSRGHVVALAGVIGIFLLLAAIIIVLL